MLGLLDLALRVALDLGGHLFQLITRQPRPLLVQTLGAACEPFVSVHFGTCTVWKYSIGTGPARRKPAAHQTSGCTRYSSASSRYTAGASAASSRGRSKNTSVATAKYSAGSLAP